MVALVRKTVLLLARQQNEPYETAILNRLRSSRGIVYRFGEPRQALAADLAATWSEHEAEVTVGPEVDRIRIVVETSPPGQVQVLSWRKGA